MNHLHGIIVYRLYFTAVMVRHFWISQWVIYMELRHLRYFITVAEELNFSKAALKLYTAQPSLSQQIKDLEEDVECAVTVSNQAKS